MFRHKQSVTGFERVEQAIHDLHALRSGHIDEETRMAAEAFATALLDALTNQDLSRVRVLLP
ncbi:MAG: hypothetical protein ABI565_14755, partial [Vicinamibacteria bacterium]